MVSFEKLLKIVQDDTKTPFQKAADLHALLNERAEKTASPTAKKVGTGKPRGRPRNVQPPAALETANGAHVISDGEA